MHLPLFQKRKQLELGKTLSNIESQTTEKESLERERKELDVRFVDLLKPQIEELKSSILAKDELLDKALSEIR